MKSPILIMLLAGSSMVLKLAWDCSATQSLEYSYKHIYSHGQKRQRSSDEWQAATFRGLVIGKSSLYDAIRVLGKPTYSEPEADRDNSHPDPPLYCSFDKGGEFPGEVAVVVGEKSKKILEIRNVPQKNLSKEEAILHFGSDYLIARYEFCPDGNSTTAPVYSDPNGQLEQIEYRKRGIVVHLYYDGLVSEIAYVAGNKALSSEEDCKKWARRSRQGGARRKPLRN